MSGDLALFSTLESETGEGIPKSGNQSSESEVSFCNNKNPLLPTSWFQLFANPGGTNGLFSFKNLPLKSEVITYYMGLLHPPTSRSKWVGETRLTIRTWFDPS